MGIKPPLVASTTLPRVDPATMHPSLAHAHRHADAAPHQLVEDGDGDAVTRALTARLAASEARYRGLANAMAQIVWISDPDGALVWLNERWTAYTGLSVERSRGADWSAAVHPDDLDEALARWRRAAATGVVFEMEYRLRAADGTWRWHLGRAAPVRDEAGAVIEWCGTATDIDDRRRAEDALRASEQALRESEARARAQADELAAVLDAVPAAVWIARDPSCREVQGNRVGHEVLRAPKGANLSKSAPDASAMAHFTVGRDGVELAPDELPLQKVARTGVELRDFEEQLHFDDGQTVTLYGSAVPLRDEAGRPRGSIAAFVDVTRLKEAEAALREADRRKDEFLATLSHELRNPLAPILTAVELMKLRGDVPSARERGVIERQALHLTRLVDDLLDVSRIARGKIELDRARIELGDAVTRAVETTSPLFAKKGQQLRVAVPLAGLALEGDVVRLAQVVSNLLTNASRYTPRQGHVQLVAAREGTELVLRVRDDGMGIAPDLLPRVFELFVQGGGAGGAARSDGGLGLGLALVRSLVQLHGGSVEAHSEGPGRGSEFVVRLPATEAEAAAARG